MAAAAKELPSMVLSRNKEGMESLRKGDVQTAFDQFKEAESILTTRSSEMDGATSLLAVTCNNLGLYYKKVGKLHGALSYLRRALKMETDLGTDEVTLAGTHLNICAILSKLDKHDRAVQHALNALDLVNRRVHIQDLDQVSKDEFSVLAISYHTLAVERECLQQFEKAADAFKKGHEVASRHLGAEHPLAISLGSKCDEVLVKSRKLAKAPIRPYSSGAGMKDASGGTISAVPALPPLTARKPAAAEARPQGGGAQPAPGQGEPEPAVAVDVLVDTGAGAGMMVAVDLDGDGEPDVMMSIAEADSMGRPIGKAKNASKDFRPSRMVKGTSRAAKLARRGGGEINDTTHRDAVRLQKLRGGTAAAAREAYARNQAARMIQRTWRAYHKYCEDNAEWLFTIHRCANLIQKVWRSYYVRRARMDKAAAKIQRVLRGVRCRLRLRHGKSAVAIQRIAKGMIQRRKISKWRSAGLLLTSLARGGLARCRIRARRAALRQTVVKIQSLVRMYMAQHRVKRIRDQKNLEQARQRAAADIQRVFRGYLGRKRYSVARRRYCEDMTRYNAATKIQSMMRRIWASDRVEVMRAKKLEEMSRAATHLRKVWLGIQTRKRYRELLDELAEKAEQAIIIQRYVRGFLVRNRMWREAVRQEEELWAALEIQRAWRGYLGRVRWEEHYEAVWLREMKAAQLQRMIKGFIARRRVERTKRRIARAEFERARLRFRAAQRIQAMARGALVRRSFQRRFERCARAVVTIQRVWRGHFLRANLWLEVQYLRATMIQAAIRGCLVRRRRRVVAAKMMCIQNAWRRFKRLPEYVQRQAIKEMRERREKAQVIQKAFRAHEERKRLTLADADAAADGGAG